MELDLNTIVHRQKLFSSTLKSYFLNKITKYKKVLLKNGVHLSEQSYNNDDVLDIHGSQSFEEHIELVIGQKSASPNPFKTFWKIGNRISTLKLFRWIYLLVQRTKAARVLHHLDGIADDGVQTVIKSAGKEIAVAFEYQLCVLDGDIEIIKLAQHAGACIIMYLNSKEAHFATENMLQAILEVKPQSNGNKEILKTRTISFNNQPICLRWRLSQVLKQPGLRVFSDEPSHVTKENPSPHKDNEQSNSVMCKQPRSAGTGQYLNIDKSEDVNIAIKETTVEENKTAIDSSYVEECYKSVDTNNSTNTSSSSYNKVGSSATKTHRRISAVDMDFDKGVMNVTDYSIEVSDFSPVGNDTSQVDKDDSTSIEEDFISECGNEHADFLDKGTKISADCENDSTKEKFPQNVSKETTDHLENKECHKTNVFGTAACHSNGDKNTTGIEINKSGAICSRTDTIEDISAGNIVDTVNCDLNVSPTLNNETDPGAFHTSEPLKDVHAQTETHSLKTDTHIRSENHINDITYQASQEPSTSNTHEETVHEECNESMPELAKAEKSYIFYGCFTPYGAKCRPKMYGYRGPLHVWNEQERRFTLIYNDTVTVTRKQLQKQANNPKDMHQMYIPKTVCKHCLSGTEYEQ